MSAITQFIKDARHKGLTNEQIKQLLMGNGWSEIQAQAAVLDLAIPPAPPNSQDTESLSNHPTSKVEANTKQNEKSISALEAALQHVLLWVFTLTSSVMIGVVSYELFGARSGSSKTLLTYLVLELVTFVPFAILFSHYLKKFRKEDDLKTGKVWSIITIVLHSIGFISSLAIFIVVLVIVDEGDDTTALLASSAATGLIYALVVAAYVIANFVKPKYAWRKKVLPLFPVLLFVIVAIFGVLALLRVGPLRADDQTRQQLVHVVKAIRSETKSTRALPTSLQGVDADTVGLSYVKRTNTTYQLCANFNKGVNLGYDKGNYDVDDSYVSSYDFETEGSDRQCFTVRATSLETNKDGYPDTAY